MIDWRTCRVPAEIPNDAHIPNQVSSVVLIRKIGSAGNIPAAALCDHRVGIGDALRALGHGEAQGTDKGDSVTADRVVRVAVLDERSVANLVLEVVDGCVGRSGIQCLGIRIET